MLALNDQNDICDANQEKNLLRQPLLSHVRNHAMKWNAFRFFKS